MPRRVALPGYPKSALASEDTEDSLNRKKTESTIVARAAIEVNQPVLFFCGVPQFVSLRRVSTQKVHSGEKYTRNRMTRSHSWLRYTTRMAKQKMADYLFIFRRFGVEEFCHSEAIFAKKRYTSVVACVHRYSVGGGAGGGTPRINRAHTIVEPRTTCFDGLPAW